MVRAKTIGYIVTSKKWGVLQYVKTWEAGYDRAFFNSCERVSTIFRDRRGAKAAIKASVRYWRGARFSVEVGSADYRIVRIAGTEPR
jgi:hypothetical protein